VRGNAVPRLRRRSQPSKTVRRWRARALPFANH